MLAAQIGNGNPCLMLFQNTGDRVLREPAALHLWSFRLGQRRSQTGLGAGGNAIGHQTKREGHVRQAGVNSRMA